MSFEILSATLPSRVGFGWWSGSTFEVWCCNFHIIWQIDTWKRSRIVWCVLSLSCISEKVEGRCTRVIRILSGRYQHKYIKGMVIGHPTSFFQLKKGNEKNREVKFFSKCPHQKILAFCLQRWQLPGLIVIRSAVLLKKMFNYFTESSQILFFFQC